MSAADAEHQQLMARAHRAIREGRALTWLRDHPNHRSVVAVFTSCCFASSKARAFLRIGGVERVPDVGLVFFHVPDSRVEILDRPGLVTLRCGDCGRSLRLDLAEARAAAEGGRRKLVVEPVS